MATLAELMSVATNALANPGQNMSNENRATLGLAPINSTSLQPTKQINYNSPQETPVPNISTLNSDAYGMTDPQKQAQTQVQKLQDLNNALLGEGAYRTEQENLAGLSELKKTQTDLAARLKTIQNEEQMIPLQMQQEALGRGITTGGLQPLQTGRLRENAIRALSVNSLLEASRGNLTTATELVDRAVKAKFDPLKEEQKTKIANLELFMKSPEYTNAEKKQAAAQLKLQQAEEKAILQKEQDYKEVKSSVLEIYKNNPNLSSDVLEKLSNSNNMLELLMTASQYGLNMVSAADSANLVFKEIKSVDAQGNEVTRIVALDPKTGQEVNQSNTNNINVFGIKATSTTKGFGGTDSGVVSSDGGTFLASQGIAGDKAIAQKLLTSNIYANLTVDQALKKWSNNGYGAEAVTGVDPQAKIKDLSQSQIDAVLNGIMKREGIATGTGTGISVTTKIAPSPISPYQEERSVRTVQSVDELLRSAKAYPGIFGRTAAAPIPDFLRSNEFRNFRSELDTLKANVAFNELTAMREASKTGGALGQVSDREGQLLQSALGALSMTQSPDNFILQLQKVKNSINRWRAAMGSQGIGASNTITAPDGTEVQIID